MATPAEQTYTKHRVGEDLAVLADSLLVGYGCGIPDPPGAFVVGGKNGKGSRPLLGGHPFLVPTYLMERFLRVSVLVPPVIVVAAPTPSFDYPATALDSTDRDFPGPIPGPIPLIRLRHLGACGSSTSKPQASAQSRRAWTTEW